MITAKYI